MSGADADGADVRPTILAIAMLALYASFFAIAPLRDFFELVPLSISDIALIGGLAVLWAVLVMVLWRTRAVDRIRDLLS
jgi:cation-transporting ATPase E